MPRTVFDNSIIVSLIISRRRFTVEYSRISIHSIGVKNGIICIRYTTPSSYQIDEAYIPEREYELKLRDMKLDSILN